MKEETKRWLKKAEMDIKTANYNFEGSMLDATIFYSQQATEKALKALQIEKFNRFDKIHDLINLSKSVNADKHILKICDKINPSYFVSRYPDIAENYSKEEVREILKASKEVLEWVKKRLKL